MNIAILYHKNNLCSKENGIKTTKLASVCEYTPNLSFIPISFTHNSLQHQ